MKINSQVYVTGSIEAVEMYCKAFGAEISFQIKTEENTYAHCELSVNDQLYSVYFGGSPYRYFPLPLQDQIHL